MVAIFRNPTCVYSHLTTLTLGFPLNEVKYGSKALDTIHPKRGRGEAQRFPVQLPSLTDLSEALQHVQAPVLQDLILRLYAEPDIEKDGRAFCSLGTLRSIDLSKLDQRLSTPLCPFPNLRNVTLVCGAVFAPAPFREFFLFEGNPGATPYYARAPVPWTAGRFEDVASAFLLAAFPLVMARDGMQLRVVKGV